MGIANSKLATKLSTNDKRRPPPNDESEIRLPPKLLPHTVPVSANP
jgi:hypothetical protein